MIFDINKGIMPYWFIGRVVDNNDPLNAARVRVRCLGVHPDFPNNETNDKMEQDSVDDQDLHWAITINGTFGKIETIPEEGDWVFGFFADGRDAQHPYILGSINGQATDTSSALPYCAPGESSVGSGVSEGSPTESPREVPQYMPNATEQERIDALDNDPAFQAELERIMATHNLTREEVYGIIGGESTFDASAISPGGGYGGLFQMGEGTMFLDDSYTSTIIASMTPSEQIHLYGQVLDAHAARGWTSASGLGILQAAPALSGWSPNRSLGEWTSPSGDNPYAIGGRYYIANPGWSRYSPSGEITPASIQAYYDSFNPPAVSGG